MCINLFHYTKKLSFPLRISVDLVAVDLIETSFFKQYFLRLYDQNHTKKQKKKNEIILILQPPSELSTEKSDDDNTDNLSSRY